jgi:hypothetical protein
MSFLRTTLHQSIEDVHTLKGLAKNIGGYQRGNQKWLIEGHRIQFPKQTG